MISVNGRPRDLEPGETLAELVSSMGIEGPARGIAVAVDGEVVPRGGWSEHALSEGARIEVVTAMQGG